MWAVYALSGAVVTGAFITMTKKTLDTAGPAVALVLQSVIAIAIAAGAAGYRGEFSKVAEFDRKVWLVLLGSGVLVGAASLLRFLALEKADASRVTPLDQLTLVFTTVFAMLFLAEKTNWKVWVGVALMVAGGTVISLGAPKKEEGDKGGKGKGGDQKEAARAEPAAGPRPERVGA